MLDHAKVAQNRIAQLEGFSQDLETSVNGFTGEWNFSDHDLIPQALRDFLVESFPRKERFNQIPLKDINSVLNEVWDGPGSLVKLARITEQIRELRREGETGKIDPVAIANHTHVAEEGNED